MVDRHQALVELYARQVLVSLEADEARLLALAETCRQRAATARTLRGGLAGTTHSFTDDVLGSIIPADVRRQAATEFADTLRRIDESDT